MAATAQITRPTPTLAVCNVSKIKPTSIPEVSRRAAQKNLKDLFALKKKIEGELRTEIYALRQSASDATDDVVREMHLQLAEQLSIRAGKINRQSISLWTVERLLDTSDNVEVYARTLHNVLIQVNAISARTPIQRNPWRAAQALQVALMDLAEKTAAPLGVPVDQRDRVAQCKGVSF
ncbi:MAG: hypothetical protein ACPGRD_07670 [Planktomarina sp.]